MSSTVKLTVKETLDALIKANPDPKKKFNKAELTHLVLAMLSDTEYITKDTKIKGGQFVTEDRYLGKEFREALAELLKGIGLKQAEADELAANYKIPKKFAESISDIIFSSSYLYMDKVGKGIRLIGEGDAIQTIAKYKVETRSYKIPNTFNKDGQKSDKAAGRVEIKDHYRLGIKSKVNPALKSILK